MKIPMIASVENLVLVFVLPEAKCIKGNIIIFLKR